MKPEDDNTASGSTLPADQTVDDQTQVEETQTEGSQTTKETEAEQKTEPDYKTLYEESEKRRAGLDRKLSRLQSRGQRTTNEESLWTGNEDLDSQIYQHPLTRKLLDQVADYELKDGVGKILTDFPKVPEEVRKAIQNNPRGFVREATTVPEALEEIEDFLYSTYGESVEKKETSPKEFPTTKPNATVVGQEREKDITEMTAQELDKALDAGEITMDDLEREVKRRGNVKEVKKVK